MIGKLSEVMNADLIGDKFSRTPQKISFHSVHTEKKFVVTNQNLQSIKSFLILEICQYHKSGNTFS